MKIRKHFSWKSVLWALMWQVAYYGERAEWISNGVWNAVCMFVATGICAPAIGPYVIFREIFRLEFWQMPSPF